MWAFKLTVLPLGDISPVFFTRSFCFFCQVVIISVWFNLMAIIFLDFYITSKYGLLPSLFRVSYLQILSGTVRFASGCFLLLRPAEFPALRLRDQKEEQLQVLISPQMKAFHLVSLFISHYITSMDFLRVVKFVRFSLLFILPWYHDMKSFKRHGLFDAYRENYFVILNLLASRMVFLSITTTVSVK